MSKFYAVLDGSNVCVGVKMTKGAIVAADHLEVNAYDVTLVGKQWSGSAWQAGPQQYRTVLSAAEWVELFNNAERQGLRNKRAEDSNTGRRLSDLWEAILITNSIDVASTTLDPFYDWMLSQGVTQGRIDELRQGVPV